LDGEAVAGLRLTINVYSDRRGLCRLRVLLLRLDDNDGDARGLGLRYLSRRLCDFWITFCDR
jgi:hypothetical protein